MFYAIQLVNVNIKSVISKVLQVVNLHGRKTTSVVNPKKNAFEFCL